MNNSWLSLICLVIPFCTLCTNIDTKSRLPTPVEKTLILPDSLNCIVDGEMYKVSVPSVLIASKATIVVSIWGDCQVCMKKFEEWNKLKEKNLFNEVQIIFIVTTTYPEYFQKIFYPEIEYSNLLLIDVDESFYSLNGLSNSSLERNTFLVDYNFKIVLRGDPLAIPNLLENYENNVIWLLSK